MCNTGRYTETATLYIHTYNMYIYNIYNSYADNGVHSVTLIYHFARGMQCTDGLRCACCRNRYQTLSKCGHHNTHDLSWLGLASVQQLPQQHTACGHLQTVTGRILGRYRLCRTTLHYASRHDILWKRKTGRKRRRQTDRQTKTNSIHAVHRKFSLLNGGNQTRIYTVSCL